MGQSEVLPPLVTVARSDMIENKNNGAGSLATVFITLYQLGSTASKRQQQGL